MYLLDKSVEKRATFADDSSSARLLFLTTAEFETVVHFTFFVQDCLLLFDFADSLLLRLISLQEFKVSFVSTFRDPDRNY